LKRWLSFDESSPTMNILLSDILWFLLYKTSFKKSQQLLQCLNHWMSMIQKKTAGDDATSIMLLSTVFIYSTDPVRYVFSPLSHFAILLLPLLS
jgi:hypothetical protein